MFEKGEYIIYGSNGVCEVQDYMNAAGETDNRTYYVLAPMRSKGRILAKSKMKLWSGMEG